MKVKIEDKKNCQKLIKIEIEPEKVKDALSEVYKSIGKDAQVPGFRKGKAPLDILKLHYNETASSEAIRHLIWDAYLAVIKENNIEPVSYPIIEDVKFQNGEEPLNFTVKVDVKPIINLKPYTNIRIKKLPIQVNEEDINKTLQSLRESFAKAEADGGKTLPPLDDALAKQAGNFENLQQLKERIREELLFNKKQQQQLDAENQLFEFLLKANQFEVPESVVQSQLQNLLNDAKVRLAYQGYKKDEIDSQEAKLKETLAINADKHVKTYFILDKIAKEENITVTEEEIKKRIEDISKATQQDAQKLKQAMEEKGLIDNLREQMLHDKVIDFLLEKAKVNEN